MSHVQMEETSSHFCSMLLDWAVRNFLMFLQKLFAGHRHVIYISVVFGSSDIYCMVTSRQAIGADSSPLLASSPAIHLWMYFPFSVVSVPLSFSHLIFLSRACVVICCELFSIPLSPHTYLPQLSASLAFFTAFPRCFLCWSIWPHTLLCKTGV